MTTPETPNIRMYDDIAIASFEPLQPEEIPTYTAINDGTASEAGWTTGWMTDCKLSPKDVPSISVSARRALKGIKRNNLFGGLDLNTGTLNKELRLKNGSHVTSEAEIKELFADEEHALVLPIYQDLDPFFDFGRVRERKIIAYQEFDAFALVPGRYPHRHKQGFVFAPNIKKADPYSNSPHWKLFRGLFFRRSRIS